LGYTKLLNGIDVSPDPLAVGLRVNGAGRCANGRTPWALLGVHLHKMKGPKQVLRAATLWEEGVPLEQLPYFSDDKRARPEKLPEVPCPRRHRADTVRCPVLDVPGQCLEIRHGHVARGILVEVVIVGGLTGGHRFGGGLALV
jgi:hypothetical protein